MRRSFFLFIPFALAATYAVQADIYKSWRAANHSEKTVKVFWMALGCTKVEFGCHNHEVFRTVCETKDLEKNELASYEFHNGTKFHKKCACEKDNLNSRLECTTTRIRNSINVHKNGVVDWRYE